MPKRLSGPSWLLKRPITVDRDGVMLSEYPETKFPGKLTGELTIAAVFTLSSTKHMTDGVVDSKHRRRFSGSPGVQTPQNLVVRSYMPRTPSKISQKRLVSLENVLNRQVAGASPRTPLKKLIALPQALCCHCHWPARVCGSRRCRPV